jgi:hypothetical protein
MAERAATADLLRGRHRDLAERDSNAERSRAVRDLHGRVDLAGDGVASALGIGHGLDREERRLGLDLVHVGRVGPALPPLPRSVALSS